MNGIASHKYLRQCHRTRIIGLDIFTKTFNTLEKDYDSLTIPVLGQSGIRALQKLFLLATQITIYNP